MLLRERRGCVFGIGAIAIPCDCRWHDRGLGANQLRRELTRRESTSAKRPQNKKTRGLTRVFYKSWHWAIFPGGLPPSIVAADRLYRRVRDGNGCVPVALAPRTF